jgi:hypothetical protein
VIELDLTVILEVPPLARAGLLVADDHADQPLGLLEWVVGVACLWWGRQVVLVATIHRLRVIMSPVVVVVIVATTTSIVATVVVVAG